MKREMGGWSRGVGSGSGSSLRREPEAAAFVSGRIQEEGKCRE